MRARPVAPLVLAVLASGLAVVAGHAAGADAVAGAQLAARWTARTAFFLFLPVYLASAMVRLWPSAATKALLRDRRWWGLAFALAHFVHLAALIAFFRIVAERPRTITLLGGGLGYALLAAMVLTSNDRARRAMGRWWKRLHRLGIHWLWFVFAFSYIGRIADPMRMTTGLIFAPLAFAALGVRLLAGQRMRRASTL